MGAKTPGISGRRFAATNTSGGTALATTASFARSRINGVTDLVVDVAHRREVYR